MYYTCTSVNRSVIVVTCSIFVLLFDRYVSIFSAIFICAHCYKEIHKRKGICLIV